VKWARWLLSLITLGVAFYLFWPFLADLRTAADLYKSLHWVWLLLPIGIQAISYSFLTWLNLLSLQPFPGEVDFLRMAGSLTAIAFIETAIPSAGVSGVALRAHLLGKHGQYKIEASIFSLFLETVFISLAMSSVGFLGLIYLVRRGELVLAAVIRLIILGIGLAMLLWGVWHILKDEKRTLWLAQKGFETWNWLVRRVPLLRRIPQPLPESVETTVLQFHSSVDKIHNQPVWKFILAAYGRVFSDVATLGSCFFIFGYPSQLGTLLTGYGMILLLSGLAGLPGGILVADVSVPVIFTKLGAPGAVSLAAGLLYRLISFWLLRFIGFVNWQILEVKSR